MSTAADGPQWTTRYPELGTGPLPIAPYLSTEQYERERERIFRRVWLNVGREEAIPHTGDYFVREIEVCNASVLVLRDGDGVVRAFHNVCVHRCNKVTRRESGCARAFVCGFHGWTYDMAGRLVRVPDERGFFDLRTEEMGLAPISVETWEGFIFVNLDASPRESLAEYLGELGEGLAGYPFAHLAPAGSYRAEVRANWKVALNSFQEGYHVPFLHRRSAGRAYADRQHPAIHALAFALFDRHRTMSIAGSASYRPTASEALAHRFGASITRVIDGEVGATELPPGLNPTDSPAWVFDMIVVFPNFFMFLFKGTYFTYHFWPLGVDRTLWETTTYAPHPRTAGERFSQECAKCTLRDTLLEDGNTLEAVQAGLASGAVTHFYVQDEEILIRHAHKVVDDMTSA